MAGPKLDSGGLDRLERALLAREDGGHAARVGGERLWRALAEAFPHRDSGPAERRLLLSALEALASRGVISLPPIRGKRWDRSLEPAVPMSVDLVRGQRPSPTFAWRTFPWHQDLAWVPSCRSLSAQQIQFLRRVHGGLVSGAFSEPAPMKYRSLQLTGEEKALSALAKTSLFGEGRLSLAKLGCQPEVLPLAWETVGDRGRLIIFENAGPFAVARRVLGELPARPYDLIAYGGGRAVLAGLGHLLSIGRPVESIHYVGDLDWAGIDIMRATAVAAMQLGLPEVLPATEVHRQMLDTAARLGHPGGWRASGKRGGCDDPRVLEVLGPELRDRVGSLLHAGGRIPEEVLGPAELRGAWSGTVSSKA